MNRRTADFKIDEIERNIKGLDDWKTARRKKELPCAALDGAMALLKEYKAIIINVKTKLTD